MPVIQLTNQFIKSHLTCPDTKSRIEYCDQSVPGLYVEVRRTNQKQGSYYLRYKNQQGKTQHYRIGKTADMPLSEARKEAKQIKRVFAEEQKETQPTIESLTFQTYIEEKYLPYALIHKRSYRFDESMCRLRILPKFGHLKLDQITREDAIKSLHMR